MSTIRLVLAGLLIASALAATTAAASPIDTEKYYMSPGTSQTVDPAAAAQAHEDYLMSYGAPEPQPAPSDGSWLPILLGSVAVALAAVAAGATLHRRRLGTARRPARVAF